MNHNPERLNVSDVSTVAGLMAKNDNEAGIRFLRNDDGHYMDVTSKSSIVNNTLFYGLAAGSSSLWF